MGAEPERSSESGPGHSRKWVVWIRVAGPYAVAAGLLVYVFYRVPMGEVVDQLRRHGGWALLPVVFMSVWAAFFLDCLAIWKTFSWFTCPIAYREVLDIRGATYLLAAVNYHLGQGGLTYFLHRQKEVDLWRATGSVLLLMGAQLVLLALAAGVGVLFSDTATMAPLGPYLIGLAGLFVVYLVLVHLRPERLLRVRLLEPVLSAGVVGTLKAVFIRLPHMAAIFSVHWIALLIFGIQLPPAEGLACLAVLFFVIVLPVSVQGLGTGQAAALVLLSGYAPAGEGQVLAYSLSVWTIGVLSQVFIGLVFMRKGTKLLGDRARPAREGQGHGLSREERS